MNLPLSQQLCIPCQGDALSLSGEELKAQSALLPFWTLVNEHHLERRFVFPDFAQAMVFANKVATIAERSHHHPELLITWGAVTVRWWTHKIKGVHQNDFIMAAKTDLLVS